MAKKRGLWANIHAKRKRGEKPAKPGEKGYPKTLDIMEKGGPVKVSVKDLEVIVKELLNASKMHKGQSKRIDKHLKMMEMGGILKGPSHEEGGIPIEVEGGEYIIKKDSVNPETEPILEFVNENGKLPKGNDYDFPTIDARKRKGGK